MFKTESEFVSWLRSRLPGGARGLRLGIGDDAAVVRVAPGKDLILTTDLSIEGIHFSSGLHPPQSVGHRALARSLSDVAAMGGTPRFALVSLALSKSATRNWVEKVYAGLCALAERFGVEVIGGDTAVVSKRAFLDVVVAGEVARTKALRRSGARPGDQILVSGRLGLSALGLRLVHFGFRRGTPWHVAPRIKSEALRSYLYPEPRVALGKFLSERALASALIDLSDGLSTDLSHLCEASGVGACLWEKLIPMAELGASGRTSVVDKLDFALNGGEDYELLFAVPPHNVRHVPGRFAGIPLQRIGEIRSSRRLELVDSSGRVRTLTPAGHDHFRKG